MPSPNFTDTSKNLSDVPAASEDVGSIKTHLNCDPVTLARQIGALSPRADNSDAQTDALTRLYRPLAIKDVRCFVRQG